MKRQMLRFGLSGVAGYLVDSGVLYLVMAAGLGFLRGRLLSFMCAVVVTWLLNRRYTFAEQLNATSAARSPLWLEFWRYLAAMAVGGFLNLATYWAVLAVAPPHPALPALGVAAGSLVGMVANFASAKWWVFRHRYPPGEPRAARVPALTPAVCLCIAQAVFWICHFHDTALPGLYMDAANPDYLAAHTLHPGLDNFRYLMPTEVFPILGNLYHGVQTYYVGLPVFALLGFNMLALRVAQGLFGSGILVLLHLALHRVTGSLRLALAGSVGLASELAFIASFRTQMYIVIAGSFWLLWAVYLAIAARPLAHAEGAGAAVRRGMLKAGTLPMFFSGVCAGLAVYSYFVFLFFVPVFLLAGGWHTRSWRALIIWSLGFGVAMQTYVLGYLSAIVALGGPAEAVEWFRVASQGLEPLASDQGIVQRLANAWMLMQITLQNGGNELMIFGTTTPGRWSVWKAWLLIFSLLLLVAMSFGRRRVPAPLLDGGGMLAYRHVAWLPLAFMAVSTIFGSRLWAHHFSPLVPLLYLVFMLAVYQIQQALARSVPRWAGTVLVIGLVFANLQQQSVFFERLETTGGVGKFSNALNRMADDALSLSPELVHVFPEWGFLIPFTFLTANQRISEIDASPEHLRRLANEGRALRLYYWDAANTELYRASLLAAGFVPGNSGTYQQRDQNTAFLWLDAVAGASPD